MPTLLQISIEVNSGSVGRVAEQIGQLAIAHGWESYIAYSRNHLPSTSKIIKIGNKFSIYWHGINTRLFDNHCLCSTGATKRLIKKMEHIKPDIIQLHNIHGYYLNMRVLFDFLSRVNIQVVWVLHDCWPFTGHCAYFDHTGCEKWKTGCHQCPQKNSYPASRLLDQSQRNHTLKNQLFNSVSNMTLVPVSYWLGGLVENSFLNKYPIHVIQNGVDITVFHPVVDTAVIKKKYGMENKFIVLGVASVWDSRKGYNDFIGLNKLLDYETYKIVLVGLNKKQIKELPQQIIGIERTEDVNELASLYSASDVFLNPTWEDTFPTTNLESLACGTPVITYRTGGSVESISDDVGIIVEKGDIKELYNAVLKINEKGKAFYTDKCRDKAVTYYDKQERYKDYLILYNQLLKS